MIESNQLKKSFMGLIKQSYSPVGGLATQFYGMDPTRPLQGMEIEFDHMKVPQSLNTPTKWGGKAFSHKVATYGTSTVKPYFYNNVYTFGAERFAKKDIGADPYQWEGELLQGVFAIAAEQFAINAQKVQRDKEYQAASEIQTGALDMSIFPESSVPSLDFGRDAALSADLTGTIDVSDTALDLAEFETTMLNKITTQKWLSKSAPVDMVFGEIAWIGLNNNADFVKKLDAQNKNNQQIEVDTLSDRAGGLNFCGYYVFGGYKMRMWTYSDDYADPAAADPNALASRLDYFDPKSVSFMSPNMTEVTGSGRLVKPREFVNSILPPKVSKNDGFANWVENMIGKSVTIDGVRMGVEGWYDVDDEVFKMRFKSHYLLMLNSPNSTSNYIISL
jgi:hypothetical protein